MLKINLEKISYFEPIWPLKFKMAGKVKEILQKSCHYSRIMEQILMFNSLFKKYFDWAIIKAKKMYFFN